MWNHESGGFAVTTYTIRVHNPIIDAEVMKVDTDNRELAMAEAAYLSVRHGVARVYDSSAGAEVARFRYGVEEAASA
ncbi:MAG TPA: hypothetical protein VKA70_05520 [Blastocatellia bacterium]|nr:hypothetical protein [Blastocatellia bacterium]